MINNFYIDGIYKKDDKHYYIENNKKNGFYKEYYSKQLKIDCYYKNDKMILFL
jgi:hypothetical protein